MGWFYDVKDPKGIAKPVSIVCDLVLGSLTPWFLLPNSAGSSWLTLRRTNDSCCQKQLMTKTSLQPTGSPLAEIRMEMLTALPAPAPLLLSSVI